MGVGVFASCERLRHLTTQLTAACSYRGARMPPAGLRPERARRINSTRVFITHVRPRRRQPATSPDANEPVLASRRPSISACLSSPASFPSSRRPSVLPPDNSFFICPKQIFFPLLPFSSVLSVRARQRGVSPPATSSFTPRRILSECI